MDPLDWFANQEADSLAEKAAREAKLRPEDVAAVKAADTKTRQVQVRCKSTCSR